MSDSESPNVINKVDGQMKVPPTPHLKMIGYGTGVHVYHWDRSTTKNGAECSPWALKKMYKQCSRAVVIKRMEEEANILKKLNHPNIVGFRGYRNSDGGRPILAMEECGSSLGEMIEDRREIGVGPYEPELIREVILSISSALHYLHTEQKMIHGDVKSYNILIKGNFDQIKLCDFGVSYPIEHDGQVKRYEGTLCWNAPEVIKNGPITSKADIYAFGLTIWEMLTLQPPHANFSGDLTNETFSDNSFSESFREDEDGNENVYGTRPKVPDDLGDEYNAILGIFSWCTEPDYLNRPTALEIKNKLQGL